MIVPSSEIKQPAAVDFFDLKRWSQRFSGQCGEWIAMFARSQSFTQFLETRLAPSTVRAVVVAPHCSCCVWIDRGGEG